MRAIYMKSNSCVCFYLGYQWKKSRGTW